MTRPFGERVRVKSPKRMRRFNRVTRKHAGEIGTIFGTEKGVMTGMDLYVVRFGNGQFEVLLEDEVESL